MKTIFAVTMTALFAIAMLHAAEEAEKAEEGVHVILLSGQSNMVRMDPNETFLPALEKEFGTNKIVFAKFGKSGKPIREWYSPDLDPKEGHARKHYVLLMRNMEQALKQRKIDKSKIKTVNLVWMQGESDAFPDGAGEKYGESLKGMLDLLKKDVVGKTVNVVIGRISDFSSPKQFPYWDAVRKAQMDVADSNPRYVWVDTDDLNDGVDKNGKPVKNNLHYTKEGYKILGERFAGAVIKLIKNEKLDGKTAEMTSEKITSQAKPLKDVAGAAQSNMSGTRSKESELPEDHQGSHT